MLVSGRKAYIHIVLYWTNTSRKRLKDMMKEADVTLEFVIFGIERTGCNVFVVKISYSHFIIGAIYSVCCKSKKEFLAMTKSEDEKPHSLICVSFLCS